MSNKSKVIKLSLMLIATVFALVMITFAWFMAINKTDPIIIESGTLRVSAELYIGKDKNDNGQIEEDEYELVSDKIKNLTNVIPGKIYSFKLIITNNGTVPGNLSVSIINITYSNHIMNNAFKIFYFDPIEEYESIKQINGEDLNIFQEYKIEKKSSFLFYFSIVGDESISSEMSGHFVKLTSFLIRLDQIQE